MSGSMRKSAWNYKDFLSQNLSDRESAIKSFEACFKDDILKILIRLKSETLHPFYEGWTVVRVATYIGGPLYVIMHTDPLKAMCCSPFPDHKLTPTRSNSRQVGPD